MLPTDESVGLGLPSLHLDLDHDLNISPTPLTSPVTKHGKKNSLRVYMIDVKWKSKIGKQNGRVIKSGPGSNKRSQIFQSENDDIKTDSLYCS